MTFSKLELIAPLLDALKAAGYVEPTPIQQQAIPSALEGRDVLGCAQTGTGKTAAFVLPLLQRIDAVAGDDAVLRALILTPTRELAAQIGDSLATYGARLDLYHTTIFGGVNDKPQIRELREGVDILVATPGRLLDLMGRGFVNLKDLDVFVLDEADRMLDMGFLPDVKRVTAALPKKRQTLFFSATMPDAIGKLANSLLKDPVKVEVTPVSTTVETIQQQVYFTDKKKKSSLLAHLLETKEFPRTIVFSRTKHGANRVATLLDKRGITSAALHGNKSQGARTRALDGFRKGTIRVLVATDIAARGIDVDGVSHVVNLDIPDEPETYVHRIGRTARAGASGVAITFCDIDDQGNLRDVERLTGVKLAPVEDHPYQQEEFTPSPKAKPQGRRRNGSRSGGGGGGGVGGGGRQSGNRSGGGSGSRSGGGSGNRPGNNASRPRSPGKGGGRSGSGGRPGGGNRTKSPD